MRVMLKEATVANLPTYTGPAGEIVLTEGSKDFNVMNGTTPGGVDITGAIASYGISAPTLISPVESSTMSLNNILLRSSPFSGDGAHTSTTWEIATDNAFTNLVYTLNSSSKLTEVFIDRNTWPSSKSTTYYTRIRHTSSLSGVSAWSPVVSFITSDGQATTLIQTIENPNPQAYSYFGISSVFSTDGNLLAISTFSSTDSGGILGRVYTFNRVDGVWSLNDIIEQDSFIPEDRYGIAIDMNDAGTVLAVGSYYADYNGISRLGRVTLYNYTNGTWVKQADIAPTDKLTGAWFGQDLSLNGSGDTLLVGGMAYPSQGLGFSGIAFVYTQDATTGVWSKQQEIIPPDGLALDYFGSGVAINSAGTLAIIGAYGFDGPLGVNTGKAYIYAINAGVWTQTQILEPDTGPGGDGFGRKVSMNATGSVIIVDTRNNTFANGKIPTKYVYRYNPGTGNYILDKKLTPADYPDITLTTGFGLGVAMNDDASLIIVQDAGIGKDGKLSVGKVYVYG